MIHFPRLQTARLDVQLRELTIRESVALAATQLDRHEAATSALLGLIVADAKGANTQPGRWTVQERMMVVAHYISCTSEAPNFDLGDGAFLDYLQGEIDAGPESVAAGRACGDDWTCKQLTGDEAVLIEQQCSTRLDWTLADMAARMRATSSEDPPPPDASTEPAKYAEWIKERSSLFERMAESDFEEMFACYRNGLVALRHLFWLDFDSHGHIVMPKPAKTGEGEGGRELPPVRFPVASALGSIARILGS
jgi:hypothetical protein